MRLADVALIECSTVGAASSHDR